MRSREVARAWQTREGWRQGGWPGHRTWAGHQARHWMAEHRTWTQRGGYGGYYIPRAQFMATFGDAHPFRIQTCPGIYHGYPRFRYGGYWFLIVDPWPEFWEDDWYLDDDVYIDFYGDGYYLFSRRNPGVSLAVSVII